MKGALLLFLMIAPSLSADESKVQQRTEDEVIHVATSLDHLTVLEFGEPVTMAAAGSAAFQIERHEDKVFIKPLKAGASTDLFVWTSSRRFAYELESPGEVKNMTFDIDSRIPVLKPASEPSPKLDETIDMMLTRAFLDSERVDSGAIKESKGRVTVRVEQVFQSKKTLYIHYSIRNLSHRPYRVTSPTVTQAYAPRTKISIASLEHMQLDGQLLRKLGELREQPMTSENTEAQSQDIQPGEETQGVVAIRANIARPTIVQLMFGGERLHQIQATIVL